MSTGLLYHGFGVRGVQHVKTEYQDGEVHLTVRQERDSLRCRQCGSRDLVLRGKTHRKFHTLPIGPRKVWVELPVQRVLCRQCRVVQQVEVPFADCRRHYTRSFERYAAQLCQVMTIRSVARHLGVSWDVIKDIHKRYLHARFADPPLRELIHMAIDEICIAHPRKYLTVVLDLDSGAVVFVGEGKGKKALEPFWKRLKRSRAKVQAVACDMGNAYISAVLEHLPKAALVLDHFHVVKYFNAQLACLRRAVQRSAIGMDRKVLKGTRWILLKNPENLRHHDDPAKDERKRLQEALQINQPLMTAYYLKEDLRQLWQQPSKFAAAVFLDQWLVRAENSGIFYLQKVAKQLRSFRFALLNWYDHPISTGPLEATNNKIKTLQRQAYGFRDREYFVLLIHSLHLKKYALVG